MIPWLIGQFPPVEQALSSPNGLLAAGGDLSVSRLIDAYRHGIFPWFNAGEPILWWSPNPRMILIPDQFKVSKSLGKVLRNGQFHVTFDQRFEQVIRYCAAPRPGANGTWISEDIIHTYCELHRLGYAHSVEVWLPKNILQSRVENVAGQNSIGELRLAGGLYGVAMGRMFYGESMFSVADDASKIALAHLAKQLDRWQFGMIDCQMSTPHLASLGAHEIPRSKFIEHLQELVHCEPQLNWRFETGLY